MPRITELSAAYMCHMPASGSVPSGPVYGIAWQRLQALLKLECYGTHMQKRQLVLFDAEPRVFMDDNGSVRRSRRQTVLLGEPQALAAQDSVILQADVVLTPDLHTRCSCSLIMSAVKCCGADVLPAALLLLIQVPADSVIGTQSCICTYLCQLYHPCSKEHVCDQPDAVLFWQGDTTTGQDTRCRLCIGPQLFNLEGKAQPEAGPSPVNLTTGFFRLLR